MALVGGSIQFSALVVGTTYKVTFTGTDKRTLNVVAKHSALPTGRLSLTSKSGMMTIDQSAVTNIAASVAAITDPA
jgi:hypothetical protein